MEGFASSVLELQTVLKNPPPANAPPSLKLHSFIHVLHSLSPSFSVRSRRVQLFAEIVDDILVGIEMFDIELFAAHLSDWKSRVYEVGKRY